MARHVPSESSRDILCARATPPGAGAIAIVRLSGAGCHELARTLFRPYGSMDLSRPEPGRLILGRLDQHGADIEEGFAVFWYAPRSYTGEEMVEFQTHGSPVAVSQVIEACQQIGARLARPGEFTRRAYLNGKMDLAQAEAVCDLISAHTQAAARAALAQLGGGLSEHLAAIRDQLILITAELEAWVDYPEEGLEFSTRERLGGATNACRDELSRLLESAQRGTHLRDGARVVLGGRPNAGKSSLFNLLVRRERALVTPHPGTTRDTVEAELDLAGIPVTLVDTAGLRADPGEIEAMGIERALGEFRAADLILFLIDASGPDPRANDEYTHVRQRPHFVIANKIDLAPLEASGLLAERFNAPSRLGFLPLSAKTRDGVAQLEARLIDALGRADERTEGTLVTNRRHVEALRAASAELTRAAEGLATGLAPELLVVHLTETIGAMDSITGRQGLDEDVLDRIFATFCLGK